MVDYYCGIGSRQTPKDILHWMYRIALRLSKTGYVLRSGGADGADSAFEMGAERKEIYLPWKGFNSNKSPLYTPSVEAHLMAEQFHPAWNKCSQGAKKLHARNCHQVLGRDLRTPSKFLVCYHNDSGGTLQTVRIARNKLVLVYNLRDQWDVERLQEKLKEIGA
jgi:hypothetical protein